MPKYRRLAVVGLLLLPVCGVSALLVLGCGGGGGKRLSGGGSSFVGPLFEGKWTKEFNNKSGIELDYSVMGSSAGIGKMISGDLDFGATDAPMSPDEITAAGGGEAIIHVPLVMGAVAIIYNLENLDDLNLSGEVLADIYLGKISKWDDEAIKKLNPGATLPSIAIKPVYRADGSGTSYIFSDFLCATSADWKAQKKGPNPQLTTKGEGVQKTAPLAQAVSKSPGAIGYVEMLYALKNEKELKVAKIQNAEKSAFLAPSPTGVTTAAEEGLKKISADDHKTMRFSIVAAPGAASYPISGTTWAVLKTKQTEDRAKLLKAFLTWATSKEAQGMVGGLHYAPLPESLQAEIGKKIEMIGK